MDNTIELAMRIQCEEFLLSRGYARVKCGSCDGKGYADLHTLPPGADKNAADILCDMLKCAVCDGVGWTWIKQQPGEQPRPVTHGSH